MSFLLKLILATIIIFFVWNILKRLFFNQFYRNFPGFNPREQQNSAPQPSKKIKETVEWDAETVDFEEVTPRKDTEKQ